MPAESFLSVATHELKRLRQLADGAMEQMKDASFSAQPSPADNSIAVIVKHVSGNMISRWTDFLTTDGEKPNRNRDSEFIIEAEDTRERLMKRWEDGWECLFFALEALNTADLERKVLIRGEALTVLEAIQRQISHYAYHVGQIVFIAKHYAGASWQSLSIPLGQSERFNRDPRAYLDET